MDQSQPDLPISAHNLDSKNKLDLKKLPFVEDVEIRGHIIDSLIFPKILDEISALGGAFEITDVTVGQQTTDPSWAKLRVHAATTEQLEEILTLIGQHGAVPVHQQDCQWEEATQAGVFPEKFYVTTNQESEVRINGVWQTVAKQEMDCGIKISSDGQRAECIPFSDIQPKDRIVVGRQGVRVHPLEKIRHGHDAFGFMNSTVSSEKPKAVTIREIAAEMKRAAAGEGKILIVAGPAIVHTGSRDHLSALIRNDFVNVLFAGNALATHDIEQSFYETSLGISLTDGFGSEEGHEHHLRSINKIRSLGSIKNAVDQGVLTSGIMYECVQKKIPYLLAGSIRDDGPLPDVVTDVIDAQRQMRELSEGVTFALMIATTLHSIAVGNLLPARVKVVCVDINPATVIKLSDRGTFQTIGLVTDVEPFMRVLVNELGITSQ